MISASFRSGIGAADTSSSSDWVASSGASSTELVKAEGLGKTVLVQEVTALAFSEEERFSISVVRHVPARSFKNSQTELGDSTTMNDTRAHSLIDEMSSLKVRSFSSCTTIVFKEGAWKCGASEMGSEFGG
jgi:hypothetical protein